MKIMECEYCNGTGIHPDPTEEEIKQYFVPGDPAPVPCKYCLGYGKEIDFDEYDRMRGIR